MYIFKFEYRKTYKICLFSAREFPSGIVGNLLTALHNYSAKFLRFRIHNFRMLYYILIRVKELLMSDHASITTPRWIQERLDKLEEKKSDKAVMKSEIRRIDDKLDDLDEDLGKLPSDHNCVKEADLSKLESAVESNRGTVTVHTDEIKQIYRWYVRGLAAMIVFLLTSGVGFAWYLGGMAVELKSHGKSLEKIEHKLDQSTPPEQTYNLSDTLEEISIRSAYKAAEETVVRMNGYHEKSSVQ